ncbi:hypothetical protein IMZ31_19075 (plasmid) [Pontibacillus sp. ALD_SL1]|uniref:hypothetical protein n=1 Tax=Pontibacillus sp. ALD_SL1 TaxID=2777185 RepID=UPI001A974DCC|nr:hypothetical protein [Pontibacillus sp. ALD_SL1]QST02653.1 hypothetical protein IMZ31_19075 [Pontibacillus sp. ALD_SL1]
MKETLSGIVKNALFAMVDMTFDRANGEWQDKQEENLSEFLLDLYSVKTETPEYEILKMKFKEEFENDSQFADIDGPQAERKMGDVMKELCHDDQLPKVIAEAIYEQYDRS